MSPALDQFCDFYRQLSSADLQQLPVIYRADIEFIDPAHRITGIDDLQRYFQRLLSDLSFCRFAIEQVTENDTEGYVNWTMTFRHPRLGGAKNISVEGISHLKFDQIQVYYHRDYFDLGAMLYEQLPLLGRVLRFIKHRLGQ